MSNVHILSLDQESVGAGFKVVALGQTGIDNKIFQSVGQTTAGAGSATIAIEASNDGVNWISLGNVNLTLSTTTSTQSLAHAYPWGFYRANVSALSGTGASVSVYMAV